MTTHRANCADCSLVVTGHPDLVETAMAAHIAATEHTVPLPERIFDHDDVAEIYLTAIAAGHFPTVAVAEMLGISPGAAAQRVRRARELGLIPPTISGRASAWVLPPCRCPRCGHTHDVQPPTTRGDQNTEGHA